MLSIVLRRWYINKSIIILDIIHSPLFYLERNISDTGFYHCLKVERIQLDPVDWATSVFGPEAEAMGSSIYWAKLSCYNFKTETGLNLRNVVFQIKVMTTDNVQNSDSYINKNISIPS
jgi:hypothetical protein